MVRLVVGLGNPGRRYANTRHNMGFLVIEEVRRRHEGAPVSRRADSRVTVLDRDAGPVILAEPQTYMNRSGPAVRDLLAEVGGAPEDLLVVCDDLALPFGVLRLRRRGSAGGHHGLESIGDAIGGGDFPRLRVGIGRPSEATDAADFVLDRFAADERERLPEILREAADCVEAVLALGVDQAMNRYNRRPGPAPVAGTAGE